MLTDGMRIVVLPFAGHCRRFDGRIECKYDGAVAYDDAVVERASSPGSSSYGVAVRPATTADPSVNRVQ